MKEDPIECPVCHAGWVEHVMIEPGMHEGMLCEECEVFWAEGEAVEAEHFTQFSLWLRREGIPAGEVRVRRGGGSE